jgi:Putative beta-barrel porin-2, OmpL-like. bbp2
LMYAGEDPSLRPIRELSVYYKLRRPGFGIEAGIMPAIFGAETFINRDNQHATRAIMTDFAPDFEAGVRFHYQLAEHWSGKVQVTNGWQVLRENNNSPAFGMVNIYEKDNLMFNWGVFVGEEPFQGRTNQLRIYHNWFGKVQAGRFSFMPMLDWGMQKDSLQVFRHWHAYGLSARYQLPKHFAIALRYERMYDPHNIIPEINAHTLNGFQLHGCTLTLEYIPAPNVVFRVEGRFSDSLDSVFNTQNMEKSRYDSFLMLATHLTFPRKSNR